MLYHNGCSKPVYAGYNLRKRKTMPFGGCIPHHRYRGGEVRVGKKFTANLSPLLDGVVIGDVGGGVFAAFLLLQSVLWGQGFALPQWLQPSRCTLAIISVKERPCPLVAVFRITATGVVRCGLVKNLQPTFLPCLTVLLLGMLVAVFLLRFCCCKACYGVRVLLYHNGCSQAGVRWL